jgi:hypothetical protein
VMLAGVVALYFIELVLFTALLLTVLIAFGLRLSNDDARGPRPITINRFVKTNYNVM